MSPGDRPLLVEGEEAMNPVRTVRLLLLVLFLGPGVARAQDPRGAITGTVNDTSGARLPGVTITATNVATNVMSSTTTNTEGDFAILFLNPGTYTVSAELSGFKKSQREGLDDD